MNLDLCITDRYLGTNADFPNFKPIFLMSLFCKNQFQHRCNKMWISTSLSVYLVTTYLRLIRADKLTLETSGGADLPEHRSSKVLPKSGRPLVVLSTSPRGEIDYLSARKTAEIEFRYVLRRVLSVSI